MRLGGWIAPAFVALVILATSWLVAGVVRHSGRIASVQDAAILSLFFFEDRTTYSAGFSEAAFRTVRPGMREAELKRMLGDPLRDVSDREGRFLFYSKGPPDASYWLREVQVDSSEIVVRVIREYCAD